MIDWDRRAEVPRYKQVASVIRQRIKSGEYPDRRLISERGLMEEFGIARNTARKALSVLREEHLIFTVRYMGSFVGQPEEP